MSTLGSFHKCTVGMVFVALTVSGCAAWTGPTMPFDGAASLRHDPEQSVDGAADGRSRSQVLMRSGIDYLYKNDLDKAQAVFNTALKFDFDNAQLHFLNALTYHQSYLRGDADSFELAKTGYRTALLRDPSMEGLAYLQLGRLYLDAKDHASATQAFAMAVDANGQSADALYGLAQAAALDGDLTTSYWAARELDRLQWHDPHLYRLKAIQAALAQQAQAPAPGAPITPARPASTPTPFICARA